MSTTDDRYGAALLVGTVVRRGDQRCAETPAGGALLHDGSDGGYTVTWFPAVDQARKALRALVDTRNGVMDPDRRAASFPGLQYGGREPCAWIEDRTVLQADQGAK